MSDTAYTLALFNRVDESSRSPSQTINFFFSNRKIFTDKTHLVGVQR